LQATVDQDLPALEQAIHALIRSLPDEGACDAADESDPPH
jgi:hypothetical protein